MGLKLFGREIIFEEFQRILTRYLIVTDRQTDRRLTVASPRSALASRGKNSKTCDVSDCYTIVERGVFRFLLKTASDGAKTTDDGNSFHMRAPATPKAHY